MKISTCMILALPLLTACASRPPAPNEELAVARSAISSAEDAGARDYAEVDLRRAQKKIEQARVASQNDNFREALQMAEQAEIDARYAAFRARSERANDAVEELERGIAGLRAEVGRTLDELDSGGAQ